MYLVTVGPWHVSGIEGRKETVVVGVGSVHSIMERPGESSED